MAHLLVDELKDQFRRQWRTIRELVANVPEEQWKVGEIAPLIPARLIYHILSGIEVYARSTSYEEYKAKQCFTLDWESCRAEELPDREGTLRKTDGMQESVERWLDELGDERLMDKDEGFPWTGNHRVGRVVYLLRHTQNHIGEINSELRRRELPRGRWG